MMLRKMIMTDADKMLEWKNYPETRRFAIISKEEIKREDHLAWLKDNIQYFEVIELSVETGEPCGAVRIQNNEISIWIDRKFWGKGVASYILEEVSEVGDTAKIVEGNVASMRAFINAGFRPHSYCTAVGHRNDTINFYIFKR